MTILIECKCKTIQSQKNKLCKDCGASINALKKQGAIRYWVDYRLPDRKQKRELIGYSLKDAKAAEGKRIFDKRQAKVFGTVNDTKVTFNDLADWYKELDSVKALTSYSRLCGTLKAFNKEFGSRLINSVKLHMLESYQIKRIKDGISNATIDMEIKIAKTMLKKAFYNDKIRGDVLNVFNRLKKKLKAGSNARDRRLSIGEYLGLLQHTRPHVRNIIAMAMMTGMREGEIMNLRFRDIDRKNGFIRLAFNKTKEGKPKKIPINHHVEKILDSIPVNEDLESYVFTIKGNQMRDLRTALRNGCKKAGFVYGRDKDNGFVFHDLRTTVKTNLLMAGVDKVLRDTLLGHTIMGMDTYYIKPSEDDLRGAIAKYTQWIDEKIAKNATLPVDQKC